MSERGVFAVDRGIWDHPLFASREPLTKREAWLWLISEASWKPRVKRIGSAVIEVMRGQLAHSVRFIAEAWRWPKSNVARFLASLKSETMIETTTVHGLSVITICNYDEYQRVSLPDRDTSRDSNRDTVGTAAGQQRDKLEDIKTIEGIEDTSLRSVGALVPAKPKRAKARAQLPEDWRLSEQDFSHAIGLGFLPVKIRDMATAFANHHRGKGTLMADWQAAWRTWCGNEIKFNGKGQANGRRTVHDAANDLLATLKSFDDPAPDLRSIESQAAVRLLPPR